jgi:hypothetical protein
MSLRRSVPGAKIGGILVALAILSLALPQPVAAYHFLYIVSGGSRLPVAWRNLPVQFTVDNTPATFSTTIQNAFNAWNSVTTAADIFAAPVASTVNFTGANYGSAWGKLTGDGVQEAICDADGTALTAVGKSPTTISGTAFSLKQVVGGQGAITDAFLIVNCSKAESATNNYRATAVHELGHAIGLAHTATYQGASGRLEGLTQANAPTMYPHTLGALQANMATLQADDIAGVSHLYPSATFATGYGTITGTVTRCGTDEPLSGVNVRAVRVGTTSTVDQISRYTGYDGNSKGEYEIKVPPGNYRLIIETMELPVGKMAMQTAVNKDFATEYRSSDKDENGCLEELPDTAVPVAVAAGSSDPQPVGGSNERPAIANQNFKTNGAELAFVIDDTGSMDAELAAVRTTLTNTIKRLAASGRPFPTTALLTFKDEVTIRRFSNNPTVLQAAVDALTVGGGDDCPEFSNDGLLVAGRLMRRGGKAMLFTDADSHPFGVSAETVSALYKSKSMRVSVLLSGSCEALLDPSGGLGASAMDPSRSQNPGHGEPDRATDLEPEPEPLGPQTSVQTNSTIVAATGGTFAAIPGIKAGAPVEVDRYINTGTNIAVSAANLPTVSLVSPGDGPRGTTIDIDITGSNTNFQSTSQLSFSGTGITVNFRLIRSATSMTANVTIDPSAAAGFRDATVTTALGGGTTETATGVGVFNIAAAPTGPTVLSVAPNSGSLGTTLNVVITAANTSFTPASTPIFCVFTCFSAGNHDPKITVNSVTVNSPTSLAANITIAADATIAFRSVGVVTGSQVATESVTGPFLVTEPALALPTITAVNPTSWIIGQTLDVTVSGVNTNFINGTSVMSFGDTAVTVNATTVTSPTTATANITISGTAPPGFRDVFVTTGDEVAAGLNAFNVLGGGPSTAEPPTSLYAASIAGTTVTLRWTPPLTGLAPTGYVLEGGISPRGVLASIPTGGTYPIFTFTAPPGVFYVRIHTLSGASRSVASNEIRIWVANQSAAPSAPDGFTGVRNGSAIALSWRNTFAGGAPASIVLDVTGSVTTSIALGLTDSFSFVGVPNGAYTLRLRAVNAAGSSAPTSSVSLSFPGGCPGAPSPPTQVIGYRIGRTLYVLWEPPGDGPAPIDYLLNVSGSFVGSFSTPTRTLSGTVPPGSYRVSVLARNACGFSTATPVQTVVVP